jgi:pimeloyl-ACP methyl ester carboxylesterase
MKTLVFVFLISTLNVQALVKSHIKMADDHNVYYQYQKPQDGKPTIVLLNGLLFFAENWKEYYEQLSAKGYGVLLPIYSTQPESIQFSKGKPYYKKIKLTTFGPKQSGVETQTFINETMAVIDHLNIDKFSLLSLSYGSTVAVPLASQFKDRINNLILISPAIVPTNRYNAPGKARFKYYQNLKKYGPFRGQADYLYDAEFYVMLRSVMKREHLSFPGVSFEDYFDGLYQMNRAVKWFDLKDLVNDKLPPVYMFQASTEEKNLKADQSKFWELMKGNEARRSLVTFDGAHHVIVYSSPKESVEMTVKVVEGKLNKTSYKIKASSSN